MPFFAQEIFEAAQAVGIEDPATVAAYNQAVANDKRWGGKHGIDTVLAQFKLDALIAPTKCIAWKIDLLDGDHFLGGSSGPALHRRRPSEPREGNLRSILRTACRCSHVRGGKGGPQAHQPLVVADEQAECRTRGRAQIEGSVQLP